MVEISGRKLIEFIKKNDLKIKLMDDQITAITTTLSQAGYELDVEGESIVIYSVDQEGEHLKNVTLDEVISIASECIYEELSTSSDKLDAAFANRDINRYQEELKRAAILFMHQRRISDAFKQTECWKNIEKQVQEIQEKEKSVNQSKTR
ncbi:MAG: hypothetical protein K5986_05380 [Clostridium sp.]|nr:hypothetical protein [Clostridium sp.]